MRRFVAASLALFPLFAPASCGDDAADPEPRVAVVGSYNLGLATGYVDYAAQRRDALVALVSGLDADVLCLQEVWSQEDLDAVTTGVEAAFPHSYAVYLHDDTVGPPACDADKIATLRTCVEAKCDGVPAGELSTCVLGQCSTEFFATGGPCQGCLAANLGQEFDAIFAACTSGSALYTYGGANGLVILSKVPLSATAHLKLDSSLTQRSILKASLELPRLGDVDFYCTHIAADLSAEITYNGDFGSFAGENIHQAEALLDFVGTTARAGARVLIAGDFNSGPSLPAVDPELPDAAFATLTAAGYTSLVAGAAGATCSFCAANDLVDDDHESTLIDHVWARDPGGHFATSSTRIGTAEISVDDGGSAVTTHPSDHFGVAVQFDYRP